MKSQYYIKRKRRISVPAVIVFVLFIISLIACLVLGINLKSKSNNIKKLNKSVETITGEKDSLNQTIAQQAASIDDLNSQLSFFATPEESGQSEEQIAPDDTTPANPDAPYPNLYGASKSSLENSAQKIAYLTFDDGPSNLTPTVLDILDQYNAKATFFVIGTTNEEYQQYYKAIVDRGHTLALHSYTHNYQKIYASVDSFLSDYEQLFNLVYEKTGQVPTLFRFPGGSKNAYNSNVRADLINQMQDRGFIYYDWNVSCGDGSSSATKESVYQKVMDEVQSYKHPVILMHDGQGHQATIDALPDIMQSLSEQGYTFEALTPDMSPVQFP